MEQNEPGINEDTTFAKQKLGNNSRAGNLLVFGWDKSADTLEMTIASEELAATKIGILGKLARIYDPLGLVAPTNLQEKLLHRATCELKYTWDAALPDEFTNRWQKWERHLP